MSAAIDQVSALASLQSGKNPTLTGIEIDSWLSSLVDAAAQASGRRTLLRISEPSLRVLGDPARLRELLWLYLGDSPPASELAVTADGEDVFFTLELAQPARSLPLTLARALAEHQGAEAITPAVGKPTQLRFRLRRA